MDYNISNPQLVLNLIKAEMRNYKLIIGLEYAGLSVDWFYTCLDKDILKLIGFNDTKYDESLYEVFDQLMTPIEKMEVDEFHQKIDTLALEVYTGLLAEKKIRSGILMTK
jgi:hypothetical protein